MHRAYSKRPPRRLRQGAALLVVVLSLGSCGRYYARDPTDGTATPNGEPLSVMYLVGDFGRPDEPFFDLIEVIAADVSTLQGQQLRTDPMVLELGDNLYENGLPRDLGAPGAADEVAKLRDIASGFAGVRNGEAQVPLVLIPGNHDYRDNAISPRGNLGDITRWYFLDELDIAGADAWTQVPGDATGFSSAEELRAHIEGDVAAHVEFMAPARVPATDSALVIIAIDSELVLDLYEHGHDRLADVYWEQVSARLADAPADAWVFVAAHHPPVTYGKHGEPSFGNWVLGQGWPQFPSTRQRVLAVLGPLGIALGVLAAPPAAVIATFVPLSTATVTGRKQDVGSDTYDTYAAELLRVTREQGVDGIFAGHDHNTQLIDLAEVPDFDAESFLLITGAGSKLDPVRRGPGTIAHLADYSFVRLTQFEDALTFEIVDRHGNDRFHHQLRSRARARSGR